METIRRTKIVDLLKRRDFGSMVNVKGWVRTRRGSKQVNFIALNDGSTINNVQVVVDLANFDEELLKQITTGSCLSVNGELVESVGAGQACEIQARAIEVLGVCDNTYPLQKKGHSMEFLREIAHLRPRTNTFGAVFRIRHNMAIAIHKFFHDRGFFYFHTPIITASDCEGAGQMFQVTTMNLYDLKKNENGSIIYITADGRVIDYAYWRMNGSELGNVAQDLFISGGKMYIISQNGGNDGLLVEAEARTLKNTKKFGKEELSRLFWPSHIAVVGNTVYIRDNAGVWTLDLDTRKFTSVANAKGTLKNRMAVVSGKVFVPGNRAILVLENGVLVKKIEMDGTVTGVIKSDEEGYLWVSCSTSPAQIVKLSAADYTMDKHTLTDGGVSLGWSSTPGISASTASTSASDTVEILASRSARRSPWACCTVP